MWLIVFLTDLVTLILHPDRTKGPFDDLNFDGKKVNDDTENNKPAHEKVKTREMIIPGLLYLVLSLAVCLFLYYIIR